MRRGDSKKYAMAAVAGATLMMCTAGVVQARSPDHTASRAFVKEAVQGDIAEIKIGRLAQRNGASDSVKQFGRRLESDHAANLRKARSLAASLGTTPTAAPNAGQKATYEQLSRLSGPQFDRKFAKKMIEDHEKDIHAFRIESRRGGPASAFASKTLPTLEAHLRIAKSLPGART